jgi:hypothetical protein
MSRRKRSPRARVGSHRQWRLALPLLEALEGRIVLSLGALRPPGLDAALSAGSLSVAVSPSQSVLPELVGQVSPGSAGQKLLAAAGYTASAAQQGPGGAPDSAPGASASTPNPVTAVPQYIIARVPVAGAAGQVEPLQSAGPVGYTPQQLADA